MNFLALPLIVFSLLVGTSTFAQNIVDDDFAALTEFLGGGHYSSPAAVRLYAVSSITEVDITVYGDVQRQVTISNDVDPVGMGVAVTTALAEVQLDFEVYNPSAAEVWFRARGMNENGTEMLYGYALGKPVRQPGGTDWYMPQPDIQLHLPDIRIPAPVHNIARAYIQRENKRIGVSTNEAGFLMFPSYEAGPGQLVIEAHGGTVVFDLETGATIPSALLTQSVDPSIEHVIMRLVRNIDLVDGAVNLDLEDYPGRYIDPREGFSEIRVDGDVEEVHIYARMRAKSGHQPWAIGVRENGQGSVQYRELSPKDIIHGVVYLGVFLPGHYQILGVYPELPPPVYFDGKG